MQRQNKVSKCNDIDKKINMFLTLKKKSINFFSTPSPPPNHHHFKQTLPDWRSLYQKIQPLRPHQTQLNWLTKQTFVSNNHPIVTSNTRSLSSNMRRRKSNLKIANGYTLIDSIIKDSPQDTIFSKTIHQTIKPRIDPFDSVVKSERSNSKHFIFSSRMTFHIKSRKGKRTLSNLQGL